VTPPATVAIVTRNRRDEVRRALISAIEQTVACELVVVDDASDDGTAEMVAAEFPSVCLIRLEQRSGTLVARNRAVYAASAEVVIMLDDDAAFSTPEVIAQTLPAFEDPKVGAVSIPHLDLVDGELEWRIQPSRLGSPEAVSAFVGCSHALRRSAFIAVEGYREWMSNYGEESELALRMLDRGYVVLLGTSDPIHHFRSSIGRDRSNEMRSSTRNMILTIVMLAPTRVLPEQFLLHSAYLFVDVLRTGYPLAFAGGVREGVRESWQRRAQRSPVSVATFRLSERLRRHEPLPLQEVSP
jgi:glycosyltransferase involved in cell wall biosynthesis